MLTKFLCKRVFYGNLVDIIMKKENVDAAPMVVVIIVLIKENIVIRIAGAVNGTAAQDLGAVRFLKAADGSIIGTIKLSPIMALIAGRRTHLKYLSLKV